MKYIIQPYHLSNSHSLSINSSKKFIERDASFVLDKTGEKPGNLGPDLLFWTNKSTSRTKRRKCYFCHPIRWFLPLERVASEYDLIFLQHLRKKITIHRIVYHDIVDLLTETDEISLAINSQFSCHFSSLGKVSL